jgi:hypothetical protein
MDPCISDLVVAASQCHDYMQNCLHQRLLMESDWAENILADFNLWAASFGIFSGRRAAFDDRILRDENNRLLMSNILSLLQMSVQACLKKSGTSDEVKVDLAWTPNPDEKLAGTRYSPAQQECAPSLSRHVPLPSQHIKVCLEDQGPSVSGGLKSAQQDVNRSFHQLIQVSDALRNNGLKSRFWEADSVFKADDHPELKEHLVQWLQPPNSSLYQVNNISNTCVTPIQERLIEANLKRRNRFLHSQKFSQRPTTRSLEVVGKRETKRQENLLRHSKAAPPNTLHHGPKFLEKLNDKFTQLSSLDSHDLSLLPESQYPGPPKTHDSESFKCPYCQMNLPSIYQKEEALWK